MDLPDHKGSVWYAESKQQASAGASCGSALRNFQFAIALPLIIVLLLSWSYERGAGQYLCGYYGDKSRCCLCDTYFDLTSSQIVKRIAKFWELLCKELTSLLPECCQIGHFVSTDPRHPQIRLRI